jgi:hypothetical protein
MKGIHSANDCSHSGENPSSMSILKVSPCPHYNFLFVARCLFSMTLEVLLVTPWESQQKKINSMKRSKVDQNESVIFPIDMESGNFSQVDRKLPRDCLVCILNFFQCDEESFSVGLVCKKWNAIVKRNRQLSLTKVLSYYALNGRLSPLQWIEYQSTSNKH